MKSITKTEAPVNTVHKICPSKEVVQPSVRRTRMGLRKL